jgi:hypothetical protein
MNKPLLLSTVLGNKWSRIASATMHSGSHYTTHCYCVLHLLRGLVNNEGNKHP